MVTAGEVLRTKREALNKTISQISQETKIQERFLEYIENDEYEKFDSDVFVNGFIKIYSDNLGLDTDRVLALYRRGNEHIQNNKEKSETGKKKKKGKFFSPKNISIGLIAIFTVLILGYIGYEIYLFQNPPSLQITSPEDGITTSDETITIEGTTQNATSLEISGISQNLDSSGNFSFEYKLNEGENTLTVTAKKEETKQESSKVLTITYQPAKESNNEEETQTDTYTIKLVIRDIATWIKLDIDGVNKVSKTLEPSETEYPVSERFEIISGKPSNTDVYINDELYNLKLDPSSGAYSLSCEIVQSGIVCE